MLGEANLNIESTNNIKVSDNTGALKVSFQGNNVCDIYAIENISENRIINNIECNVGDLVLYSKHDENTKFYMNKRGELIIDSDETGVYSINSDGELIYTY